MSLSVDIIVKDIRFEKLPNLKNLVLKVCNIAYGSFGSDISATVSVILSDDKFIRNLNNSYRNIDKATNVLSFPASDDYTKLMDVELLGDIIISYDTLHREAEEQVKIFNDHFVHLLIHGMLHLLGMDHIDSKDAIKMETLEINLLSKLGIKNPYV